MISIKNKVKKGIFSMFGMEYILAFMKIMTNIGFSIVTAIPMYFSWNRIVPKYFFQYVPSQFIMLSYWDIVSFFLVCLYLGEMIQQLTPKIISVNINK